MAWTNSTPCSFCGREIPILRRFGDGKFCSPAHQDAFLRQQNELAVEILHRTHDALKAYRPTASSIEDILGVATVPPAPSPLPISPVSLAEEYVEPEEPPSAEDQFPFPEPEVQCAPVADVFTEELREFDLAASVRLPQFAQPIEQQLNMETGVRSMDPAVFHFGDSVGRLQRQGFLWSLQCLWERLASRRA